MLDAICFSSNSLLINPVSLRETRVSGKPILANNALRHLIAVEDNVDVTVTTSSHFGMGTHNQ